MTTLILSEIMIEAIIFDFGDIFVVALDETFCSFVFVDLLEVGGTGVERTDDEGRSGSIVFTIC